MGKAEITVECFDLKIKGNSLFFMQRSRSSGPGVGILTAVYCRDALLFLLISPHHLESRDLVSQSKPVDGS
jgi:hypothetical protein